MKLKFMGEDQMNNWNNCMEKKIYNSIYKKPKTEVAGSVWRAVNSINEVLISISNNYQYININGKTVQTTETTVVKWLVVAKKDIKELRPDFYKNLCHAYNRDGWKKLVLG